MVFEFVYNRRGVKWRTLYWVKMWVLAPVSVADVAGEKTRVLV